MEIDAKTAAKRLRRGDIMRMEFREDVAAYWFESPFNEVTAETFVVVTNRIEKRYRLIPAGDGLFGASTSQSWRAEKIGRGTQQ